MKEMSNRVTMFIASIVGSVMNFYFLLDHRVKLLELTKTYYISIYVNHGLFYLSLFNILVSLLMKKQYFRIIGIMLVFVGLSYLVLFMTFEKGNYLYLVPLVMYVFSGYSLIYSYNRKK